MIHQPLGGFQGQASYIDIHESDLLMIRDHLYKFLSDHSGHHFVKIGDDTERDYFMRSAEAAEYVIMDEVLYIRD